MSLFGNPVDTYVEVHGNEHGQKWTQPVVADGTGKRDNFKISHCTSCELANRTFIGSPAEDDIDIVGGGDLIIGPNDHSRSKPQGQNVTAKGGLNGVLFRGHLPKIVIGQYSNYDKWFALPKTRNIMFDEDATGSIELWYCEHPKIVPPGVKVKVVHPVIVYTYFFIRSVMQTIGLR